MSMMNMNEINKLREMVKEIDFCMLTTIDENGDPHSRPMSTNRQIEFNGDLWFFTYGESHKALEIKREPKVNASFADPKSQNWVSMTGTAEIVRDRRKMEELWQPQLKAWFPKGLDEPDIALLKVNVQKAEYWDAPASTIAHAYSLASSLITGQPADPGENRQVDLRRGVARDGSAHRQQNRPVTSGGRSDLQGSQGESHRDYNDYGGGYGESRRRSSASAHRYDEEDGGIASAGLTLLAGAALGGALLYLFDPERGASRRTLLTDKASSLTETASRAVGDRSRDLQARARGAVTQSRSVAAEKNR